MLHSPVPREFWLCHPFASDSLPTAEHDGPVTDRNWASQMLCPMAMLDMARTGTVTARDVPSEAEHGLSASASHLNPLLASVLSAVDTVAIPDTPSAIHPQSDVADRRRAMLRVLTYSYAAGVYASSDIELAQYRDPALRSLAGGVSLECAALRAFRRRNRIELHACLAKALAQTSPAIDALHGSAADSDPGYRTPLGDSIWAARGPLFFELEAKQRVQRAIREDTALLDE